MDLLKIKKCGLKLWRRDMEILGAISMCPHSVSQLAREFFSSKKKCSERMTKLFQAKLVQRIPMPNDTMKGKPEFVYYEKKKGVKMTYAGVLHSLGVVDFKLWINSAIENTDSVKGCFHHGQKHCDSLMGGLFIPDGWINLVKGDKKLLYFVEVDCGTESLTSKSGYAFGDKLDLYAEYFDSEEYNKDYEYLGIKFKGFRLLTIFRSQKRMKHFVKLAKVKEADFVLCTTFEHLKEKKLFDKCWTNFDEELVNIVGKH